MANSKGSEIYALCYSEAKPHRMYQYDIALKELFQSFEIGLTERLAGVAPVEWLNVELTETRAQRVDFVCRLADGGIFHMEFQSSNDPAMAQRMLDYFVALYRKYGSAPRQFVLYVGKEPLKMPDSLDLESLKFEYSIVDIGSLNAQELWNSPSMGDVILSILCRQPDPKVRIGKILERLRRLEPELRERAVRLLLILSCKRDLSDKVIEGVKTMAFTLSIDDDKLLRRLYNEGMEKGIEKGRNEGRNEGEAHLLRIQLQQKFGTLSLATEQKLQSATQPELDRWGSRILSASSIDEVLQEVTPS